MANLYIEKVVAALPATLEANCIYYVRKGLGVTSYVTDSSGNLAHAHIQAVTIPFFCRANLRTNGSWRGHSQANGPYTENWSNSFGTGPTVATNRTGFAVKAGDYLREIQFTGVANNNEVNDMQIRVYHNDGSTITLLVDQTMTLNGTTTAVGSVPCNISVPAAGNLIIIFKEGAAVSANRLVYLSAAIEIERLIT